MWRHWWEELAKHHALVRFDQRGSGLSDRQIGGQSFERWVSDLGAVVADLGLVRLNLLGISQGGAMNTNSTPAGTVSRPGSSAGPAAAYCRMAE